MEGELRQVSDPYGCIRDIVEVQMNQETWTAMDHFGKFHHVVIESLNFGVTENTTFVERH